MISVVVDDQIRPMDQENWVSQAYPMLVTEGATLKFVFCFVEPAPKKTQEGSIGPKSKVCGYNYSYFMAGPV